MIVSRFVSSHTSHARLHVNARTRPLRQAMRQARTVARRGGDSPSHPRTSTNASPLRSHGVALRTAAPEPGQHARSSFNDSRRKLILTANYRPMSVTVVLSMRNVLTCSDSPGGQQPSAELTEKKSAAKATNRQVTSGRLYSYG